LDVTGGVVMGFFIVIILAFSLFIFGLEQIDDKKNYVVGTIVLILSVALFLFAVLYKPQNNSNSPKAIDVYRGKTELEITYRDTVAIDSTVVWKKEYEKVSD
jgi:hypothetical protein